MTVSVPSFAKINIGLRIGTLQPDGFHELRTVYQTIALHDVVRVSVGRGSGIEIRCTDPRVPCDSTNTCWRIVERAMPALGARVRVVIEIEKRLPVQGGLGGASGNAVAALLGLEQELRKELSGVQKLRIAAEVGSDLPLFLIGGTVLGTGRGEDVYPLLDLPAMPCVIALPEIAVSTPKAFADWDILCGADTSVRVERPQSQAVLPVTNGKDTALSRAERNAVDILASAEGHSSATREQVPRLRRIIRKANDPASLEMTSFSSEGSLPDEALKLTHPAQSDRMLEFSREICAWLAAKPMGHRKSGVSARGGGRAENLLLDLVRTGIENDFEKVVFPQYPELSKVKSVLERAGARYASLSGSGSAVYGIFGSRAQAEAAAGKLEKSGTHAVVTGSLTRRLYWRKFLASS